jgi:hypothetical protein
MSVLHPSSIRPFLIFRSRHHVFPNVSFSKHKTALLSNDGVLPTTGTFTQCFEENFLPNDVFLPNSAHKSLSFLYQFLVLTDLLCFLDCYSGYHQIEIKEEDQEKTAFITLFGAYCYTTMSFVLKNAGATYLQAIQACFKKTQQGR